MKRRIDFKGAAHRKKYLRAWYRKNRDRILSKMKEPEQAARRLELHRKWVAEHADHAREVKRLYWLDPANKARKNARARARRAELRAIRLTTAP